MNHNLKTWPSAWEATAAGRKQFEIRSTVDRDFAVGDTLLLRMWSPTERAYVRAAREIPLINESAFTSQPDFAKTVEADVIHIEHGGRWGLPPGLCVMGIAVAKVSR